MATSRADTFTLPTRTMNMPTGGNDDSNDDGDDSDDPFGFKAAELRAQRKKHECILPRHMTRPSRGSGRAMAPLRSTSMTMPRRSSPPSSSPSSSSSEHLDDVAPVISDSKPVGEINAQLWRDHTPASLPKRSSTMKRTRQRAVHKHAADANEPANGKRAQEGDEVDAFVIEEEPAIAL
ncbi:hypothetical protein SYNPS1DRAFT_28068 [Syncephalis pseudoplumigaleata]|uniref:Uncharacterized protein n=1 Tax=Syncephalis pseudoplumigaleata TaxID=1712513 RepID=A0A4P9Z361_9FUNG|nr:hypothetical protein SYNPS1DRAFT_28068 [Syncephalis pseudoplumigaleata]|eukprot:RKP26231.1 hypothetical protein SYNPS1DRAFT_28068 [Syncephalis pseudoplumigaleata]